MGSRFSRLFGSQTRQSQSEDARLCMGAVDRGFRRRVIVVGSEGWPGYAAPRLEARTDLPEAGVAVEEKQPSDRQHSSLSGSEIWEKHVSDQQIRQWDNQRLG